MTPSTLSIEFDPDTITAVCDAPSFETIRNLIATDFNHNLSRDAVSRLASELTPLDFMQRLDAIRNLRKPSQSSSDYKKLGWKRKKRIDIDPAVFKGQVLEHRTRQKSKYPSHGFHEFPTQMSLKDLTAFLDKARGISRDNSKYYDEWGKSINGQWVSIADILNGN
jgi:hypothetical protein